MKIANKIVDICNMINVAEMLDDEKLSKIAKSVIDGARIDEDSRAQWLSTMKKGMKIAQQFNESKNDPWPNASNVKFPLIANGAITFAAREYPQIVRGDKVVEVQVIGKDIDGSKQERARRLSKYHSWQLLNQSDDWEGQTDKLLHMVAVVGTVFRKMYFSPVYNRTMFDLCKPEDIIIHNNAENLTKARRVTHRIYQYLNDIIENMRLEVYSDIDPKILESGSRENVREDSILDEDAAHEILEQHTFLDLDGDGYKEPYIVTVHKKSEKVLRIVSRFKLDNVIFTDDQTQIKTIIPDIYFIDYHFIPNPDGSFYSMGFGTLLLPLNHSINTLINQLLDAGSLSNLQAGFIGAGVRIKGGTLKMSPGHWEKLEGAGSADIAKSLVPLPTRDPSDVLFKLLGLMIDVGKDLASVSDILQGQMPTQNSPATSVLALIKQGLTQYNAIHKRTLRSFKKEFELLFEINSRNFNAIEYLNVLDDPLATQEDFNIKDMNVCPVADPNMSSDAQRIARSQALMQTPGVNPKIALSMYLDSLDVPEKQAQDLLNFNPPPPAKDILDQAQAQLAVAEATSKKLDHMAKAAQMQVDEKRGSIESQKVVAEIGTEPTKQELNRAQAVLALSQAGAAKENAAANISKANVAAYAAALSALDSDNSSQKPHARKLLNSLQENTDNEQSNTDASSGLAQQQSDAEAVQPPTTDQGGLQ